MSLFYLSSGLFLGWSLGANDAANVFGTAVGTKMVRFKTAAIVCSIGVVLGAVIGGAGATHTLTTLGSVNALAGAFTVASAAALTVFWMSSLRLPVSTSQAIVGAIIGWNFYAGYLTDYNTLVKIVLTWVVCPLLAAVFAVILFLTLRLFFEHAKIHLLEQDLYTRLGLLIVGAFGSYSLGANNIANVMGVFVTVSSFHNISIFGWFTLTGAQQLFFLGGLAIGVGVFTYSRKVMQTVGSGLFRLSPEAALVVVLAHAMVLFLFSSEGLAGWLVAHGMPPLPLVPVSSTQAVVGGIIGIGLVKGARGIKYGVLGEIASGWLTTPIIAGVIAFVALFFLENVFKQEVSRKVTYRVTEEVIHYLEEEGLPAQPLVELQNQEFERATQLDRILRRKTHFESALRRRVIEACEYGSYYVDPRVVESVLDRSWFTPAQLDAIRRLQGRRFHYRWQLLKALESASEEWKFRTGGPSALKFNKELKAKRAYLVRIFGVDQE